MNKFPIFECKLADITDGVVAISIVDVPAVLRSLVCFNKESLKLEYNYNLHEIVAPVLIPDQLIFRENPNRYVYFSKDTIKEIAKLYLTNRVNKTDINHNSIYNNNIFILESWFNKDDTKYPVGTWLIRYKIEDNSIWDKIINGDLSGLSIEGVFEEVKTDKYKEYSDYEEDIIDILLSNDEDEIFNKLWS